MSCIGFNISVLSSHLREQEELEEKLKNATATRRQRRLISYCEDQGFLGSDDDEWEEFDDNIESEDDGIFVSLSPFWKCL